MTWNNITELMDKVKLLEVRLDALEKLCQTQIPVNYQPTTSETTSK